ncbi:hypothetical protein ABMA28_013958 [Loxostege sticticalis]|uniref:Protein-L-isoaspartate O-methyltransferase domain-containing protein 1 n=1 Tax=Loxostege sticticalis TaxID=481309 RepID=A0ABD0TF19_LOXSC
MGGAVSSGRDNNELIDNLMGGNYIRTRCVERVFRALDRADYMTPEARDQAYKDLAWRNGPLHMSAPCIYSEVMEGLELRPGLSFLNVGSGTGYLSTLVGLILGSGGISHGIEVHPIVVEYATKKMSQFLENSPTLDEFDFCEPKFYSGNGLCLAPLQSPYDRVYCGAGCPEEYQNYFKQLIKVGGLLVMPLNDNLIQVRRVGEAEWVSRSLLNVSFATLRVPTKDESADVIKLDEQTPPRLQILARAVIRSSMRAGLLRRHPELQEPPQRQPPAKKACPRRICIPIEDDSDVEGLNALHDLDRDGGAREMNALLSLVLSMGQNRVAGALRFDPLDSPIDSSTDEDDDEGGGDGDGGGDDDDDGGDGGGGGESGSLPPSNETSPSSADRSRSGPSQEAERWAYASDGSGSSGSGSGVPAEVEIYLGKARAPQPMDWEHERAGSAPDTDDDTKSKEDKRQKLDSGIGEETTPTSDSSPVKSDSKTDESDADGSRPDDSLTDDVDDTLLTRRRLQKRGRCLGSGARSPSSTSWSDSSDTSASRAKRRARAAPRSAPSGRTPGPDARRVRLSVLMKRGVKELPLPHALKKYVNLGRCFEF